MEIIFEFILELILESGIEASKSRNIPKYIRYPLIGIISLFFIAVIGIIFLVGILLLKENIPLGIFLMLIGLILFIMCIIKFKKTYLIKTSKK